MNRILATGILGAFLAVASAAQAGYVYTLNVTDEGDSDSHEIRMSVEGDSLKIDSSDMSGSMIFKAGTNELLMIDPERRQYYAIDEAVIEKVSETLAAAREKMDKAMENVPAAQRSMMQRMMPKLPEPAGARDYKITDTGEQDTIGTYKARKVEVIEDGEKVSEAWVADLAEVDGADDFVDVTQHFAGFFSEMMNKMAGTEDMKQPFAAMMAQFAQMKGFPVLTKTFEKGKLVATSKLVDVQQKPLGKDTFSPPADYKEKKIELPE